MPKLKSLRGAIGSYGRVAAGGIIDVSEDDAKKLLKTGRFLTATDADIEAARKRQQAELAVETVGATPGFSAMPAKPEATDRLSQMIERGEIDRDKAKEIVELQISLSTEEIQGFIQAEADRIFAEVSAAQADLETREQALVDRENELTKREADLDAREKAVSDSEKAKQAASAEKPAAPNAPAGADEAKAKTAKADR